MTWLKSRFLKYLLKLFPERKLFCPIPFKYMELVAGGKATLCCYISKSPGKVSGDNLMELYNSPLALEIRESILDGTFRYCDLENCPHFLSGDLPLQKDCIGTPFEGVVANQLTVMDKKSIWITFDDRCNLRCISCRADFTKHSENYNKDVEALLDVVKANLGSIEQLGLCGSGDPLASPSLRNFLYSYDAAKYPNLKITLLTNGLLFTKQAWEHMKTARAAIKSVQVSVDAATAETYEKIRVGGSFERLMENLKFISGLRKQGLIREFIISFVVSAINFREMDRFVSLGLELGCDQVYFSKMVDWGAMSKEQYKDLAVHLTEHKAHGEFRKKLEEQIFGQPIVFLGNLEKFRAKRILRDSMFS